MIDEQVMDLIVTADSVRTLADLDGGVTAVGVRAGRIDSPASNLGLARVGVIAAWARQVIDATRDRR